MPRYFFNVHDVKPSIDEHGEELPDDEAAWKEATSFAGALIKDIDGEFRPGRSGAWKSPMMLESRSIRST
jgi:hypothetical protein